MIISDDQREENFQEYLRLLQDPDYVDICFDGQSECFDGFLDGICAEIKAIESNGRWSIRTKISKANKQGAQTIILYFPEESLFSESRVKQGWIRRISACFAW